MGHGLLNTMGIGHMSEIPRISKYCERVISLDECIPGFSFSLLSTPLLLCVAASKYLKPPYKFTYLCLNLLSVFTVFRGTGGKVRMKFPRPFTENQTAIADIDVLISVKLEHGANSYLSSEHEWQ